MRWIPLPASERWMRKLHIAMVCATVIATAAGLLAQSGSIRHVPPSPSEVAQGLSAGIGPETKIIGTVIDIGRVPVASARVQLRSLVTGVVHQQSESSENGEYEFAVDEPGTYVVEMVTLDGFVIALSNAVRLERFGIPETIVQLPGRWDSRLRKMVIQPHPASFLGMGAASTITAATVRLAADTSIPPVSSGEPVSAISPK
jgi:hypothetical protein